MGQTLKIGIVGGGIVGLATALRLGEHVPFAEIHVFEKESTLGAHQSSHNSGVLHCGLFYKPGSLKARLAVQGIRQMVAFCRENGIRHELCGKLVVATNSEEAARLGVLAERGAMNGLQGLRQLNPEEIREREPNVVGVAALEVPEEGIVDYPEVCKVLGEKLILLGHQIHLDSRVGSTVETPDGWDVGIGNEGRVVKLNFLVNCAGLYSDRVCRMSHKTENRILPFRGEYYKLASNSTHLVRHLVYPVPDLKFPFLGVHFTRMVDGSIEAGPNAVLALSREGYHGSNINFRDAVEALLSSGLWNFALKHKRMCLREIHQSFSKQRFCRELQKLIPAITTDDLEAKSAGVRAQAVSRDGELLQDFALVEGRRSLHVINAPSPAATASLAIGEEIALRVAAQMAA